jgi:sodium-dependent dicarboxylate transporter 2/3/5
VALLAFTDLQPGEPAVTRTAAVAVWMALWWILTPVPLAVTAMLPVILFPALGVLSAKSVSGHYFNHIIFLFLGGFLIALAMERWNLHRRMALFVLMRSGSNPLGLLAGFMIATAFLSMWISNTATALMMVPIALAVLKTWDDSRDDSTASSGRLPQVILLGIAYAASIGGTATLVGTPPNLALVRNYELQFPGAPELAFSNWMMFATPLALAIGVITWAVLVWMLPKSERRVSLSGDVIRTEYQKLGRMSFAEKIVLIDFALLALLWMTRKPITLGGLTIPGWASLFPDPKMMHDAVPAVALSALLFAIPSRTKRPGSVGSEASSKERILEADIIAKVPWGIVLLFGGGFALSAGFKESGLSLWVGDMLSLVADWPPWLIIAVIAVVVSLLTELTSNTATAEILLPILAALAITTDLPPLMLMIPGALACSFAFILPVATPPNAVVFGSERVDARFMARCGVVLNLLAIILTTAWVSLVGNSFFPQ